MEARRPQSNASQLKNERWDHDESMVNIIILPAIVQVLLLWSCIGNAFVPASRTQRASNVGSTTINGVPSPEASAKALTDYMAKAHEEKLKAVKAAEEKKQAEIEALKAQINELKAQQETGKGGSIVTATLPAPSGSIEELQQKLVHYQNFIAKYVVESQEAKIKAIADAQAAVTRKYEAILLSVSSALPPSSSSSLLSVNPEYDARNARVRAAAQHGASRWGDAELQRLDTTVGGRDATAVTRVEFPPASVPPAEPAPPTAILTKEIPPEVIAADHGMRADGGVGGLTLAERVMGGAAAVPLTASVAFETVLYHQRNQNVAKWGSKSRWGPMEVEKAIQLAASSVGPSSSSTILKDTIEKADHGLRADGAVGGPSLAERVNFGAQLLGVK